MWCKLNMESIWRMVNRQLNNYWEFCLPMEAYASLERALERLEENFSRVRSNYYKHEGETAFKIEHTVQYSIFLYLFSNQLFKDKYHEAAAYVYYLNKIMHAVDWFYEIELPVAFCAEHPVGCVLGRAQYGNYFFVYQGVTIGGNRSGRGGVLVYPQIGDFVVMYSDSKVIGRSKIGNNVIISANTYIKDEIIPDNSIVFGSSPNLIIKRKDKKFINNIMTKIWILEKED